MQPNYYDLTASYYLMLSFSLHGCSGMIPYYRIKHSSIGEDEICVDHLVMFRLTSATDW